MEEALKEEKREPIKCFVMMPIADIPEYGAGHFDRVYKHLIIPACVKAGFKASRADDTKSSNLIILDILQQIYNADMVICDLSAKNPNVMYELGIRQAFELPTVLIKDDITSRIFDISSLRDVEYDHTLRIDTVGVSIDALSDALTSTYNAFVNGEKKHINSIVSLLGISPAKVHQTEISQDTSLILDSIKQLYSRINAIENDKDNRITYYINNDNNDNKTTFFEKGDSVKTRDGRSGTIFDFHEGQAVVRIDDTDNTIDIVPLNELKKPVYRKSIKI
ncbi:hypothetical protein NST69_16585 [Paenibacillus sp. FSL P2-0089]|uniref:hypothetical protein n=1 Tax=Paenibacillus sp. FSL P2-0089 TaxID=2954526 RepID=UPI003159BE05